VTYRNCTGSDVWVTPYYSNGSSWWVYTACKHLGAWAWDSWTVQSPSFGVNFGVATCDGQSTHGETHHVDHGDRCWTEFRPANPGPGGYVEQDYINCGADAAVIAAYREADGDLVVYLHDGVLYTPNDYTANWWYFAPWQPATLLTAFAINLP
jgi:hypothetical protein